jgi:hypothetical protein
VHAHEPVAASRGSAVCAAFTMGGTYSVGVLQVLRDAGKLLGRGC